MKDARLDYPPTRRVDHVDTYHGIKVDDPYRWLEDDVRNSPEVAEWVKAENKLTESLPGGNPRARDDPPPLDRALELRPVLALHERRRPLLLLQERRPAKPARALRDRIAGRPSRGCLIDPNTWSKDGTIALGETGLQRRRQVPGLQPLRGRQRLVDLARPGNRHRPATARRAEVDQVLQRLLDQGRQGLLLQPLRAAQAGRRVPVAELQPQALLPSHRHAASGRRAGLLSARASRVAVRRRGDRRRPLPGDLDRRGDRRPAADRRPRPDRALRHARSS